MWRPMQAEALAQGELGDHARRSVLRKTYLYLALFASVIGGMATAVGLVYQLIRVVLTGDAGSSFVNDLLNLTQLLFLFGVVLVYHLNVLRADGASTADALAEKQSTFNVLVVDFRRWICAVRQSRVDEVRAKSAGHGDNCLREAAGGFQCRRLERKSGSRRARVDPFV